MRILFSTYPGLGHVNPLLPLARALADAGHIVRFATGADSCQRVSMAGFHPVPAGLTLAAGQHLVLAEYPELRDVPSEDRAEFLFGTLFGEIAPRRRLPDLLAIARSWQPDLIVHEPTEYAAPLIAELLDIPSALHAWGPVLPHALIRAGARAAEAMWVEHALSPRDDGGMYRGLYLDICPRSMQSDKPPTRAIALRPGAGDVLPGDRWDPATFPEASGPAVVITFGSIFHEDTTGLAMVARAVDILGGASVIAAGRPPESIGDLPESARAFRYLPISLALEHGDAFVTHGGASSIMAAARSGCPALVIPQGADHHLNAAAAYRSGFARLLPKEEFTQERIVSELRHIQGDALLRDRARSARSEIEAMPDAADIVVELESYVCDGGRDPHV